MTEQASRTRPGGRGEPVVVVGTDGSAASRPAMLAAARSAVRRHARLLVLMAYTPPEWAAGAWGDGSTASIPRPDRAVLQGQAFAMARGMLGDVLAQVDREDGTVPVADVQARPGRPVDVLLDAVDGADELVVGHGGRGAVASRLLGSVGLGCVLHAPCPVTVVPDPMTVARLRDRTTAPPER